MSRTPHIWCSLSWPTQKFTWPPCWIIHDGKWRPNNRGPSDVYSQWPHKSSLEICLWGGRGMAVVAGTHVHMLRTHAHNQCYFWHKMGESSVKQQFVSKEIWWTYSSETYVERLMVKGFTCGNRHTGNKNICIYNISPTEQVSVYVPPASTCPHTLHFAHKVCPCISYDSYDKDRTASPGLALAPPSQWRQKTLRWLSDLKSLNTVVTASTSGDYMVRASTALTTSSLWKDKLIHNVSFIIITSITLHVHT